MVAKGHDFPDVSLGVVLDADATLRFPDFRAEERTFALIAQLAGRAGRGGDGRVLVQTIAPDARAILHAARHDSDGFLAEELGAARALSYPPFSHLIRIVLSAEQSRARAGGRGRAARAPDRLARAWRRHACSGRPRCFACAAASARCSSSRPRERRDAVAATGDAVQHVAADRAQRRRELQRGRRPAVRRSPDGRVAGLVAGVTSVRRELCGNGGTAGKAW